MRRSTSAFDLPSSLQRVGDVVDGAHPREHRLAVVLEHVADLGVLRATCRRTGSRRRRSGTSPAIMLISVDLPQPLGPNTETILCLGMSRSKFSYSGQPAKYLVRPRIVIVRCPAGPGHERRGDRARRLRHRRRRVAGRRGRHLPLQCTIRRSAQQEQHVERIAQRAGGQDRRRTCSCTLSTCCASMMRWPRPLSEPMNISATITITSAIDTAERRPTKVGCRLSQTSTSLEDLPARRAHHLGRHHALLARVDHAVGAVEHARSGTRRTRRSPPC